MPGIHLYTLEERKEFAENAKEVLEALATESGFTTKAVVAGAAVASAWIALAAL